MSRAQLQLISEPQPTTGDETMIPPTKNGLPSMACVSALQKCVRRGMEVEAMEFAVELMHTSKGFMTMVVNRLYIICHEDIDNVAAPHVFPFVRESGALGLELYKKNPDNPGAARMVIGNAIRVLCHAPKSRIGDHFQASVGLRSLLEGYVPEIPDWANDGHTLVGKKLGRGLEHFRTESAKLVNTATVVGPHSVQEHGNVGEDQYADEAYRLWELKQERGVK